MLVVGPPSSSTPSSPPSALSAFPVQRAPGHADRRRLGHLDGLDQRPARGRRRRRSETRSAPASAAPALPRRHQRRAHPPAQRDGRLLRGDRAAPLPRRGRGAAARLRPHAGAALTSPAAVVLLAPGCSLISPSPRSSTRRSRASSRSTRSGSSWRSWPSSCRSCACGSPSRTSSGRSACPPIPSAAPRSPSSPCRFRPVLALLPARPRHPPGGPDRPAPLAPVRPRVFVVVRRRHRLAVPPGRTGRRRCPPEITEVPYGAIVVPMKPAGPIEEEMLAMAAKLAQDQKARG